MSEISRLVLLKVKLAGAKDLCDREPLPLGALIETVVLMLGTFYQQTGYAREHGLVLLSQIRATPLQFPKNPPTPRAH